MIKKYFTLLAGGFMFMNQSMAIETIQKHKTIELININKNNEIKELSLILPVDKKESIQVIKHDIFQGKEINNNIEKAIKNSVKKDRELSEFFNTLESPEKNDVKHTVYFDTFEQMFQYSIHSQNNIIQKYDIKQENLKLHNFLDDNFKKEGIVVDNKHYTYYSNKDSSSFVYSLNKDSENKNILNNQVIYLDEKNGELKFNNYFKNIKTNKYLLIINTQSSLDKINNHIHKSTQ